MAHTTYAALVPCNTMVWQSASIHLCDTVVQAYALLYDQEWSYNFLRDASGGTLNIIKHMHGVQVCHLQKNLQDSTDHCTLVQAFLLAFFGRVSPDSRHVCPVLGCARTTWSLFWRPLAWPRCIDFLASSLRENTTSFKVFVHSLHSWPNTCANLSRTVPLGCDCFFYAIYVCVCVCVCVCAAATSHNENIENVSESVTCRPQD